MVQSQLVQQYDGSLSIRRKLDRLLSLSVEQSDHKVLTDISLAMEQLNAYKDSLYRTNRDLYNKTFGFQDVSADQIRSTLGRNEILLEYTFLDSVLYIFGFDGQQTFVTKAGREKLETAWEQIRDRYQPELMSQLYSVLVPEFARGYSKYLIVPDENLFYFNFEQLVDERGDFLIQSKTFRYAYSASIVGSQTELTNQKKNQRNIVAMTPGFLEDLKKYYLDEIAHGPIDSSWLYYLQQPFLLELAKVLSGFRNSDSYTDSRANEWGFKSRTDHYQIIHLGTHGQINDASPMFSRLIFAKDSLEDGYLHAYEIFGMDLDANLVVLSACETGTGAYSTGEGVISLAHAFTRAGCPSVLMSLWQIDEKSSAQILRSFYKHLFKGETKSTALRKAKLEFLASAPAELKDPYYWAGLVIMGDDSSLSLAGMNSQTPWLVAGVFVLGFIFLGVRFMTQ